MRPTVAVIGGGISGLSAAYELTNHRAAFNVIVLEASDRAGGVLETTQRDGFLIESAADNFLTTQPAAIDLCRAVGIEDCLISTNGQHRQSFVLHGGRLEPIPAGFVTMAPNRIWPMVRSPVLSWRGKLRVGCEYFIRRGSGDGDESVASFVRRRFGRELYERLVQPLVGSIYGGSPERLSMEATMPRFLDMEREFGSLIRSALHQRGKPTGENSGGAPYSKFAALRHGMSSLVDRLVERLPRGVVQLRSPVKRMVQLRLDRWLLAIGGEHPQLVKVNAVIIAAPAYATASLLAGVDSELAAELREIEYSSCAVVSLGYRREQVHRQLDGFGFVVPLTEQRNLLSCSIPSIKYEGRAPDGAVLMRVFLGGDIQQGLLLLNDDELIELAHHEVGELLDIRGVPILSHLSRRLRAMPQYRVGHRRRLQNIEGRLARLPTVALAGSAYGGVGIPSCIQSGRTAAQRVRSRLEQDASGPCGARAEAEASV